MRQLQDSSRDEEVGHDHSSNRQRSTLFVIIICLLLLLYFPNILNPMSICICGRIAAKKCDICQNTATYENISCMLGCVIGATAIWVIRLHIEPINALWSKLPPWCHWLLRNTQRLHWYFARRFNRYSTVLTLFDSWLKNICLGMYVFGTIIKLRSMSSINKNKHSQSLFTVPFTCPVHLA
jgi:hypothetical protein